VLARFGIGRVRGSHVLLDFLLNLRADLLLERSPPSAVHRTAYLTHSRFAPSACLPCWPVGRMTCTGAASCALVLPMTNGWSGRSIVVVGSVAPSEFEMSKVEVPMMPH